MSDYLTEDTIKRIEDLLQEGRGNTEELEHILRLLKNGQPLPPFDRVYLDKILAKNSVVYRGINQYKSEGTTLVLSLFFGVLGFMGIGHRYVGNVVKSIGLLYAGWVIMIASILMVSIVANTSGSEEIPPLSHSNSLSLPNEFEQSITKTIGHTFMIGIAMALPVGYLALYVWQTLDARKQTRFFNNQMDKTGRAFYEMNMIKKIIFAIALVLPVMSIFVLAVIFGFFGQQYNLQTI
jgi:hypothetical protein